MDHVPTDEQERIRLLAQSLDCISESDFCLLAGITACTAENWRKRGKGPAYSLIGNTFPSPRAAVADFVRDNVRERRATPAKGLL